MSTFYRAYGLRVQSFIPLWEVDAAKDEGSHCPDVVVSKGQCPLAPHLRTKESHFELEHRSALLFWKNIGCFWVREGQEVVIEPAQGVADHLLRPALLSPVMAMLLFQRGYLVLHASAVALREREGKSRAVCFLGDSRMGKSTMATALFKRGHQPLADDTVALPIPLPDELTSDSVKPRLEELIQPPLVYPALPHFKLRPPSLEAFGETPTTLSRWHLANESYVLPIADEFSLEPAPLHCLYVLEEGNSTQLELLPPQEALMNLLRHSYCLRALPGDITNSDFLRCAQLTRQTPVFRLQRPKDFRYLQNVIELVEEHSLSLSPTSTTPQH